MYDDLHAYVKAGSLKFPVEAKKATPKAKAAAKEAPKKLMQVYRQDSYDKDPDTTSKLGGSQAKKH